MYDPLGLAGPIVQKARLLFQATCAKGGGWSENVPTEEQIQFNSWMQSLKEVNYLTARRDFEQHYTWSLKFKKVAEATSF